MFSKTCEYAIRALIYIAQRTKAGQRVSIKEVASGIGSPEHFIAKILQALSKKNLVLSFKGPTGGFAIDPQSGLTLADIVKAVDGDKVFSRCGLGLAFCSKTQPCPIHHEFEKVRNDFSEMLYNAKLIHFSEKLDQKLTFLKTD